MAIQTRYAGDAQGVNNVDSDYIGTLGTVIATGLTKNPTAVSIVLGKSQTFALADSATGGTVETFLRQIAVDSTIVMYQVNSGQLSVLLEAAGNTTTNILARITALGNATVAGGSNIWANAATLTNTGFKLAQS
jgi:cytolysin (calcineurin-like family phosphatase)